MIDFKITFQADNLLWRVRKDESDFKNNVQKIYMTILNQNLITSLTKFKHSVLPSILISHYGFGFLILSVSFSIGSILLESA